MFSNEISKHDRSNCLVSWPTKCGPGKWHRFRAHTMRDCLQNRDTSNRFLKVATLQSWKSSKSSFSKWNTSYHRKLLFWDAFFENDPWKNLCFVAVPVAKLFGTGHASTHRVFVKVTFLCVVNHMKLPKKIDLWFLNMRVIYVCQHCQPVVNHIS